MEVVGLFKDMFMHLVAVFKSKVLTLVGVYVSKESFTLFTLNAECLRSVASCDSSRLEIDIPP